jgi:hypothetical protein
MTDPRGILFVVALAIFAGSAFGAEATIGSSSLNGGGSCAMAAGDIRLYGSLAQAVAGTSEGSRSFQFAGFWTPWLQAVTTDVELVMPKVFCLRQNFPNPFNPSTTIRYSLAERSRVVIAIFNVAGQRVKLLRDSVEEAGERSVQWDGRNARGVNVASGIYFCEMRAGKFVGHRKMILLR